MVAALGGIGENSVEVRAAACAGFEFLGLRLDPGKNRESSSDRDISSAESKVRVLVIRAQEEWAIARACWESALATERKVTVETGNQMEEL
jgi:acetate kinase